MTLAAVGTVDFGSLFRGGEMLAMDRHFDRLESRARYLSDLVALMADEIGRLTDEITATRATVDAFRDQKNDAITALNKTITDLQAQLAAGPTGGRDAASHRGAVSPTSPSTSSALLPSSCAAWFIP